MFGHDVHDSVVAAFPRQHLAGLLLKDDEFVAERNVDLFQVDGYAPFREVAIVEHKGALRVPLAQCLTVAAHGKLLVGTHHRSHDTQCQRLAVKRYRASPAVTAVNAVDKHRRIVRFVVRHVLPSVVKLVAGNVLARMHSVRCAPLPPNISIVVTYQIAIVERFGIVGGFDSQRPQSHSVELHFKSP